MSRGYLFIGLSATGFGLMPVIATFAYRDGLTVATLLCLRFALAARSSSPMPYATPGAPAARALPVCCP
jgi:hypothetical protein